MPLAAGRAEIGIQLHPWVNPPFEEEVTPRNSFAGNLPRALEHAKFRNLREAIERNFEELRQHAFQPLVQQMIKTNFGHGCFSKLPKNASASRPNWMRDSSRL